MGRAFQTTWRFIFTDMYSNTFSSDRRRLMVYAPFREKDDGTLYEST